MAAVTVTPDTKFNTSPNPVRLKMLVGEASFGAYESGGVSMTIPGIQTIVGVFFDPVIAGYVFQYVPSSGKVLCYDQSGASGVLDAVASGTALAATGTFFAVGF